MQQADTIISVLTRIAGRVEQSPALQTDGSKEANSRVQQLPPACRSAAVLRYVKLPDKLENGRFDEFGRMLGENEPAALTLSSLPGGPWQCWGALGQSLEPGQYGYVIFTNVKGQAAPGGAFTEWNCDQSTPYFTDRLLRIFSVQRAPGLARIIGRNDSGESVDAAAGLLFVPPPEPQKHDRNCPRRST
jgi:hypothetical protein